jgi:CRISPR-associated protein Cmr1
MPQVTEIDETYQMVTPCFCGGAGQQPEFRVPSFKGVLRFWWRAIIRARLGSLEVVQREEARLFGSADGGQSRVRMWLASRPDARVEAARTVLARTPAARYLGYGMTDSERSCLLPPFPVTLRLEYRPPRSGGTDSVDLAASLSDALTAVGLFGGIGAKSRKGFGSLVLTGLRMNGEESWSQPGAPAELAERVAGLARQGVGLADYPEYTALSTHSRFLLVDGGKVEALRLVELIGREYKTHVREVGEPEPSSRAGFGLPRHVGRAQSVMGPAPPITRRASPLFIHVHECGGRPVAVLSFLPARFLPAGQNRICLPGLDEPVPVTESALYPPITDFFARLADRDRREPDFPSTVLEVGR